VPRFCLALSALVFIYTGYTDEPSAPLAKKCKLVVTSIYASNA